VTVAHIYIIKHIENFIYLGDTMRYISILFLLSILVGCSTTPIPYQSKEISLKKSPIIIDRMVMTRHRKWKPDYFIMTEYYFGWDYGSYSSSRSVGGVYNGIVIGKSNSTIREVGERIYYDEISEIKLLDWTRKFKQWYVVTLYDDGGQKIKHMLRTRKLEDAKSMVDALNSFLKEQNKS